jgi:hypothetical protein
MGILKFSYPCGWRDTNIFREAVVSKYNVVRTSLIDSDTTPLQVGNGNFAFGMDNTGMQVCGLKMIGTSKG